MQMGKETTGPKYNGLPYYVGGWAIMIWICPSLFFSLLYSVYNIILTDMTRRCTCVDIKLEQLRFSRRRLTCALQSPSRKTQLLELHIDAYTPACQIIQPAYKVVHVVSVKPPLHDTTCCQTGCQTGLYNRLYRVNGV